MKAIVTGSGGLIGSECARLLCEEEWQVIVLDNDMRRLFSVPATNAFKAYRREVIEGYRPLIAPHFNLTVELP